MEITLKDPIPVWDQNLLVALKASNDTMTPVKPV